MKHKHARPPTRKTTRGLRELPDYPGYAADSNGVIWSIKGETPKALQPRKKNSGGSVFVRLSIEGKKVDRALDGLLDSVFPNRGPEKEYPYLVVYNGKTRLVEDLKQFAEDEGVKLSSLERSITTGEYSVWGYKVVSSRGHRPFDIKSVTPYLLDKGGDEGWV